MRFTKFLICAVCTVFAATPAKAEIFQWGDPELNLSLTFPDDWRRISNQSPDDVLTIIAPGDNDFATCRLRVREDRRFVIYPREYASPIQHINFSHDFWDGYTGEDRAAQINAWGDNANLGKGFASWADVSFVSPSGTKVEMRGIALAANYNDHDYIAECSAEVNAYGKWYHSFLSILKSVDMRPEYFPAINAHYRDFQNDGGWKIWGGRRPTDVYIYP